MRRPPASYVRVGAVETGPFYVAVIGPGTCSTSGGLKTDVDGRVLKNGEPIPGLYAAGCNAGSVIPTYYAGGTGVGQGIYTNVLAANTACGLSIC